MHRVPGLQPCIAEMEWRGRPWARAERVRVLPWRSSDTPGVVFDGTHRTASLSLLFDLGPTPARTDVDGASDVAGFAALGGLLDGLTVGPRPDLPPGLTSIV